MAGKRIVVTYFLEDPAHEAFITPLVPLIAREMNISIQDDVRSAEHGSQVRVALRRFLYDSQRRPSIRTDLLVVGVDGNCKGYQAKRNEMQQEIQHGRFTRHVVYAIPAPHVERWYLCDLQALRRAISPTVKLNKLPGKCERDLYKNEYRRILKEAGINIVLEGYEYARAIVEALDIHHIGAKDQSLGKFIDDLRAALKTLAQQT